MLTFLNTTLMCFDFNTSQHITNFSSLHILLCFIVLYRLSNFSEKPKAKVKIHQDLAAASVIPGSTVSQEFISSSF